MPELPEVETLCRQLNAILPGEKVLAVEILDPRLGEGEGERLIGRKIAAVYRRGKSIRIAFCISKKRSGNVGIRLNPVCFRYYIKRGIYSSIKSST